MWRVVLDYIALTSALLNPHGSPARLLDFARQGRLRLFATSRMVATEGRVLRSAALRRRHGLSDRELSEFLAELPVLLCLVDIEDRPHGKTKPAEELTAFAARARADFLVTSLPVNAAEVARGGTQTVTADQLVELIGRGD